MEFRSKSSTVIIGIIVKYINCRAGECIKFTTISPNNVSSIRFGIIESAAAGDNAKMTILAVNGKAIERLFCILVLEETLET